MNRSRRLLPIFLFCVAFAYAAVAPIPIPRGAGTPGAMVSARAAEDDALSPEERRARILESIEKGILDPYRVPFHLYINLGMIEPLAEILADNNDIFVRRRLPGLYYSRPYRIGGRLWLFENTTVGGGAALIFDPETLEQTRTIDNTEKRKYDGTVREIAGDTVISGGGDADVDAAVIWDTTADTVRSVNLNSGHYIGAIAVRDDMLYIGACGGLVNAWRYPGLEFEAEYAVSDQDNVNWRVFNQKECVTAVTVLDGRVVGAGERTLYYWEPEKRLPVRRVQKKLPNSDALFHGRRVIEYQKRRIRMWDLATEAVMADAETEAPVADLIVTDRPVLPGHAGDILIVALRYNRGLRFFDLSDLSPLGGLDGGGGAVAAFGDAIYATDDRNLYRYHIADQAPEKYAAFIAGIAPERIDPDRYAADGFKPLEDPYGRFISLLSEYPPVLAATGMAEGRMAAAGLSIRVSLRYGRMPAPEAGLDDPADEYGYKAAFEVTNDSEGLCLVTLSAAWSGAVGAEPDLDRRVGHPESPAGFFVAPGQTHSGEFAVGPREPAHLILYPLSIAPVTAEYRDGLMTALSPENTDMSLVERYLADERAAAWREALQDQRRRLEQGQKRFWLFRLFD